MSQQQLERLIDSAFSHVPEFRSKVDIRFEPLQNVKSFWSDLYIAYFQWKENFDDKVLYPNSLFIKIPIIHQNTQDIDDDMEDNFNRLVILCRVENNFYNLFSSGITNFPIPRMYSCENFDGDGTGGLVCENLFGKVTTLDYLPGFNDSQVMRIMEAIAGFHFDTITKFDLDTLREKFTEPGLFNKNIHDLQRDFAMSLEEIRPEWFKGRIKDLDWIFEEEYTQKSLNYPASVGQPFVIVHYDMNVTNFLWSKSGDNQLAAVIDFQQVHLGAMSEDILRVLCVGLSYENRVANTERYLKHYHKTLSDLFNDSPPFSFEEVIAAYDTIFPFAAAFSLFGIVCYYGMYKDGKFEENEESRQEKCEEYLKRAKGIVDDIERLSGVSLG